MLKGKVLITGIAGFIGSRLAAQLKEQFPEVELLGVDRSAVGCPWPCDEVDLLDDVAVRHLIDAVKPDLIFHMAGVVNSREWKELYCGNVVSTINVLQAVLHAGLSTRVVIPGSAAEYGRIEPSSLPIGEGQIPNPVSIYGVSKVWQTTTALFYVNQGIDVVIGRLFNVIGPGVPESLSLGAFAGQLKKIKAGELPPLIRVGNLKSKRDFLDIRDACCAFLALARSGKRGEIYNICSGKSVSMDFIIRDLMEKSGVLAEVVVDPSKINAFDIEDIFGLNHKICRDTSWASEYTLSDCISSIAWTL